MKSTDRIISSRCATSTLMLGSQSVSFWIQLILFVLLTGSQEAFSFNPSTRTSSTSNRATLLFVKRNKKTRQGQDDDLDRWYDDVDDNASPDDVFWQEMERQRLMNQLPNTANEPPEGTRFSASSTTSRSIPTSNDPTGTMGSMSAGSIASGLGGSMESSSSGQGQAPTMDKKSAEATLEEFSAFSVKDNWLDEDLVAQMAGDSVLDNFDENAESLDQQLEEWESEEDTLSTAWIQGDEPWDCFGEEEEEENSGAVKVPQDLDSEFLLTGGDEEQEKLEAEMAEEDFQKRIEGITINSRRLEKARNNPKAATYFSSLQPDAIEGYDTMWVSAIENACMNNLMGTFRNYGVQFADNFGDWEDGRIEDGIEFSIEDVASYKARQVYEVTGLPCVASRTSFEIEPVPTNTAYGSGSRPNENPRVLSGYRFNDVGAHVDYMCEALKLFSEPTRVTEFRSCLCYYDGEMELFDYGVVEVDLHFSNSMRTFIPMAQAISEMMKKLQLAFGLEYQKWLRKRVDEAMGAYGGASLKLRDRVLKEGKVLPNEIIDVSSFMDSKVDVNLMDDCAKELSKRFVDERPTKILTIATTGLVIALPMAKYLQVPVVYARKERNVVMADTFKAGYSSKTVGKNRELLVSTDHIDADERILIVDDFLSSGASQEALLRIVAEAGAEAVGVGVLLEKVYDSGRQSLSGFGIKVHSMCRVASVKNGVIQLVEEDGYDRM